MAGGAEMLCITEKWVRDKINLHMDSLDTVRSLSLPGSYHHKISRLGRALLSFSRLKHLDLSRNAIESLEGLEHLKNLETLNLYYNNVPDLKEVFRLRHNTQLQDLDMRLNPVTKNEPDYRLFIVHMLVHLRTLDERLVTDGERKAALMHFDTSQAHDFDRASVSNTPSPERATPTSNVQKRLDLVKSIAPVRAGLGVDTDELLELMAEKGDTLFTATHAVGQTFSQKDLKRKKSSSRTTSKIAAKKQHKTKSGRKGGRLIPIRKPLNELEANTEYQPIINFTPHPDHRETTPSPIASPTVTLGNQEEEERQIEDLSERLAQLLKNRSHKDADKDKDKLRDEVYQVLRGLTCHKEPDTTKTPVKGDHIETVKEQEHLKEQLLLQSQELERLRGKDIMCSQVQELLESAQKDMTSLRESCQSLLEENVVLKEKLSTASAPTTNDRVYDTLLTTINQVHRGQESVQEEVHCLSQQHHRLLTYTSQLQDVVAMLQESHKTLVATNHKLLQDMEDNKQRYTLQVNQLNTNYQHLRTVLQQLGIK